MSVTSFGGKFATAEEHVRSGFARIMNGTNLPEDIKTIVFAAYIQAHATGDPRAELGAFKSHITGDFEWPWFEKNKLKFEKTGAFPYMWKRRVKRDGLTFKVEILAHTVTMAVYSAAHAARRELFDEIFMRTRGEVISPPADCPVENNVAELFNLGEIGGNPPFFPGDRSMVVLKSRVKLREFGFSEENYRRCKLT
jgi:hypothetical protein